MNRVTARIASVALLLLFTAVATMAGELWDRAVDLYDMYGDMLPGRMSVRFDQYNGRGKLVSSELSEIEVAIGPSGEVESRITYASKNGEDITEERQDNAGSGGPFGGGGDEGESNSPFAGLQKSPFDPLEQDSVTVTDTGRLETVNGVRTQIHLFEHSTGGVNVTTGTVWIALETGEPVRLAAGIEPLPGFIHLFQIIQTFETDSNGKWYMNRMEFIAEGNILFVKRRLESELRFSEYFLPPPEPLN